MVAAPLIVVEQDVPESEVAVEAASTTGWAGVMVDVMIDVMVEVVVTAGPVIVVVVVVVA